ncbi:MAG: hypothetical protein AAF849_16095 [Bacteroidota bacterium]
MNRFLTILVIIGVTSCDSIVDKSVERKKAILSSMETERKNWEYDWGFEREQGSFLRYICEGENMFIEYGNKDFKKIMEDTFPCTDPYTAIPRLWWDNNDFICLRFGCGSPCWGTKILSLNKEDTVQTYMYQYGYDDKRNVIIYLEYEVETDKQLLVARNLKSKEIKEIEFEACDNVAFIGYCIDSVSYQRGELFLRTRNEEELRKGMDSKGSNVLRRKIEI